MSETETTTIDMTDGMLGETPAQDAVPAEPIVLPKIDGYIQSVGRRKTATARIRMFDAKKMSIIVNDKKVSEYFPTEELVKIVHEPFTKTKIDDQFEITVIVRGGGIHAQAEAIRHGIARALTALSEEQLRSPLKKQGLLKRDPRKKERKKPGLRKARKSAQWSKR